MKKIILLLMIIFTISPSLSEDYKVLVQPFEFKGLKAPIKEFLSDQLRAEIMRDTKLNVLDRTETYNLIKKNDFLATCVKGSCMDVVSHVFKIKYIVHGTVEKKGNELRGFVWVIETFKVDTVVHAGFVLPNGSFNKEFRDGFNQFVPKSIVYKIKKAGLTTEEPVPANLELPEILDSGCVIRHLGYTLCYDELHEQAMWVAYELTSDEIKGTVKRTDDFRPDPAVKTGSADLADYRKSGYDRGHLAPAADMKWSKKAMSESFFMSNMSPKKPKFNRVIWKKLEGAVRTWAKQNKALYVVTGPVLDPKLPQIGPNKVSVPKFYYKALLDYTKPEYKAIGFIMPNKGSKAPVMSFAVTVDSVESMSGLNFFPALPDSVEDKLEGEIDKSKWQSVKKVRKYRVR